MTMTTTASATPIKSNIHMGYVFAALGLGAGAPSTALVKGRIGPLAEAGNPASGSPESDGSLPSSRSSSRSPDCGVGGPGIFSPLVGAGPLTPLPIVGSVLWSERPLSPGLSPTAAASPG